MQVRGKVGVLFVHGMGRREADFAVGLEAALRSRIPELRTHPELVQFHGAWWGRVTEPRSRALIERMQDVGLDWERTRRFVMSNLSNAVAYQRLPQQAEDVYGRVHRAIATDLAVLEARLVDGAALVVVAHSLGTHVISNYTWDRWARHPESPLAARAGIAEEASPSYSEFQNMASLAGIVMYGSSIPVLTIGYDKLEPLPFPDIDRLLPQLRRLRPDITTAAIHGVCEWHNFYDKDDVLGYPLGPLGNGFEERVHDHQIRAGWLTGLTPLAHMRYEADTDLLLPTAQLIRNVLHLVGA